MGARGLGDVMAAVVVVMMEGTDNDQITLTSLPAAARDVMCLVCAQCHFSAWQVQSVFLNVSLLHY